MILAFPAKLNEVCGLDSRHVITTSSKMLSAEHFFLIVEIDLR